MKLQKRLDAHGTHIGYQFECPGCNKTHAVGFSWGFNNSYTAPSFYPSVLVTGRDFTPAGEAEYQAWYDAGCPPTEGRQFDSADTVCHSWITDGQIEFFTDSTHALAGKKVELPEIAEAVTHPHQ